MTTKKKRTKKYRPRPVRAPAMLYEFMHGKLTDEQRAEMDAIPFVHLDILRRGEGTPENAWEIQGALRHAWILTQGFEDEDTMQLTFLLAFASLNAMAQCMRMKEPLPAALFEPVELALEYLTQMKDALSRTELLKSMRATLDSGCIYAIAEGAGFLVDPTEDESDYVGPDVPLKRIAKKPGGAIINGKARAGYLRRNKAMSRWEWQCTGDEDTVVPLTKPFVLLLAEPIKPCKK